MDPPPVEIAAHSAGTSPRAGRQQTYAGGLAKQGAGATAGGVASVVPLINTAPFFSLACDGNSEYDFAKGSAVLGRPM
jgi:hypothetical protein